MVEATAWLRDNPPLERTAALRSRSTNILGERFYIYASKAKACPPAAAALIWSRELRAHAPPPPLWMIELAEQVGMIEPGAIERLPRGVIVGTAVIERVEEIADLRLPIADWNSDRKLQIANRKSMYRWHLAAVERARGTLRKPTGRPQPVWFEPF